MLDGVSSRQLFVLGHGIGETSPLYYYIPTEAWSWDSHHHYTDYPVKFSLLGGFVATRCTELQLGQEYQTSNSPLAPIRSTAKMR